MRNAPAAVPEKRARSVVWPGTWLTLRLGTWPTLWLCAAAPALAAEDLRPLKPAVGPNLWLPALLAAIAVLAAVGILSRARGRLLKSAGLAPASVEGSAPQARMTLRARLEQVRDARWIEDGSHLRACDSIAEVMRDLARARWVVSTPRLTTAELLGELAARGADRAVTAPLADVLEACDLVKFAGARFRADDLRGHLDTAFVLVDVYGSGTWEAVVAERGSFS